MTKPHERPPTLIDLLRRARRSNETATNITSAEIEAAYYAQRGPYRKRPYFVVHAETDRTKETSNRGEEWLARRLYAQQELVLPDGDQLQLLDYQFPLKAARSDVGVGKVDLVGVTRDGTFGLVELKIGGSTENPVLALLEVLAYGAIVRDNLPTISSEALAKGKCSGRLTDIRHFIIAQPDFWDRWRRAPRARRWSRFCCLHQELSNRFRIDCLALDVKAGQASRPVTYRLRSVDMPARK